MTQLKPFLSLSRLVVTRHGEVVYDHKFHLGVNIIRGDNSHGKSTIADMIFFALGGDMNGWKQEAATCDFVFAEIKANDAKLTLKREINDKGKQALYIFFGDYESAQASAVKGWMVFPYRRTDQTESLSQALFRALQMPETTGDGSSNITMHQLLRLIYLDQMTAPDALMRFEEFDSALMRRTVVDYLLGIYDDLLYQEQLDLREAKKQLEVTKGQLTQLEAAFDKADIEIDPTKLKASLDVVKQKLRETNALLAVSEDQQKKIKVSKKNELGPLIAELTTKKAEVYRLRNEVQGIRLEVQDSEQFVESLSVRLAALDDADLVRDVIGSMTLLFCPQCLSPLEAADQEEICSLCKQKLDGEITKQQAARMRQEIAIQIKESTGILSTKRRTLEKHASVVDRMTEEIRLKQAEYERLSKTVQTKRDEQMDRLLIQKGGLERETQDLIQKIKIVEVLELLRSQKKCTVQAIERLEISIKRRLDEQKSRYFQAMDAIKERTLYFLRNDLDLEMWFKTAQTVTLHPEGNTFAVDNVNRFSASSITFLKNSIHFGILFASLDLDFVRYPRFILSDNIEDKGMTQERSQNFQRLVVKKSREANVEHQIIFTTSMIDPTLDTEEYCVGPKYIKGLKTLKIESASVSQAKDRNSA